MGYTNKEKNRAMKPSLLLNISLLLIICFAGYSLTHLAYQDTPPAQKGLQIPPFEITSLDGKIITHNSHKNKIILINFWATWCAPCIKEFPDLLKLAADNPDHVALVALSSDIDKAAIEKFLQKLPSKTPPPNVIIALDTHNITASTFGTVQLPETLIFDKTGIRRKKIIGADWDITSIQTLIDSLK